MYFISKLEVIDHRWDQATKQLKPVNACLHEPCGSCNTYTVDGRKSLSRVIADEKQTMIAQNQAYFYAVRKGSPSSKILYIHNPRAYDIDEWLQGEI